MKNPLLLLFMFVILSCSNPVVNVNNSTSKFKVGFSPNGQCEDNISELIHSAKSSVKILAYGFTNKKISESIVERENAGIDVQIVLDKSNLKEKSEAEYVSSSGKAKVFIDHKHAIAHNKVIIIDESIVETGSYNFTEAAQHHNAENCLIIYDEGLAKTYLENFNLHLSHSEKQ
jgi:phosphatidylserine/phosphatidylglycerophosphate/cardiolipin synthase-like enzyme